MKALLQDIRAALRVALDTYATRRHLRRGGCPDELPF